MQSDQQGAQGRLRRGIRRGVRTDATAFGYSILITATFGVVQLKAGPLSTSRIFLFVVGATLGFAVSEAVASRGFRIRIREERSDIVLVGTALAPVSVSISLAAAFGVTAVLTPVWTWLAAPLTSTIAYIAFTGAQMALARAYEDRHPPSDKE